MAGDVEVKKIVVDTDLLIRHALGESQGASTLRRLVSSCFCYTTVFHAIEAFALCTSKRERDTVERSMRALKILGLNAKNGKSIGALYGGSHKTRDLHLLAAGVCMESRLPLVTMRPRVYRAFPDLTIMDPETLLERPRKR